MKARGLLTQCRFRLALAESLLIFLLAAVLPLHAAQPGTVPRIGYVTLESEAAHVPFATAFRDGLRDHGYIEGRSILIEWRYAPDAPAQLPGLMEELVRLRVDAIVTDGTQPALAARRATATIPIIVPSSADLVGAGLAASLARPGGNVTGAQHMSPELASKRLALLKEVAPRTRRVGVLWNPDNPASKLQLDAVKVVAPDLGLDPYPIPVRQVQDIDRAFPPLVGQVDAVLVTDDPLLDTHRTRITAAAARSKVLTICGYPLPGGSGCVISYGTDLVAMFTRAGRLVDLILKGAKPADVPIEQPTTFQLLVDVKAARAIGRKIPKSVLDRADKVAK
jgi:putative ABC transport system substrate-binding protein